MALRTGSVVDAEIVIAPQGLPPTRVLCTGQVLRDEHGTSLGAVVAMHDVTVLRAGEEQLREQAAFHDAVLAASPDLIYLLDPIANRNLWSSGNLLDMLGYTDAMITELGTSIHAALVHRDDVPRAVQVAVPPRDPVPARARRRGDAAARDRPRRHRRRAGRGTAHRGSAARPAHRAAQPQGPSDRLGLALRRTARTGGDVAGPVL